jgi:hypothetical protein
MTERDGQHKRALLFSPRIEEVLVLVDATVIWNCMSREERDLKPVLFGL